MRKRTLVDQMLSQPARVVAQQGEQRSVLLIGVEQGDPVFRDSHLHRAVQERLHTPEMVLMDTTTRPEYGAKNASEFGPADLGLEAEINGQQVTIAGFFRRGAGLAASGAVVVNERGFDRLTPPSRRDRVTLGLVRLKEDADPKTIAAYLNARFSDVEAVPRVDVIKAETKHWTEGTNYGLIFRTGVVIALLVGTTIVYQVLASDIASLLPEYATLKAMGYRNAYLSKIVLQQAFVLAVMSLLPGWFISIGLYTLTSSVAGIPIEMTLTNVVLVCSLTLVMCAVSGIAAMGKAFQAEPADLF